VNIDRTASGGISNYLAPPVLIVGMHRSGTSFLTGSLQLAGLELGEHSEWNRHNQKGNRENQEIVAFHDTILARNGFAWDNPPPGPLSWTEEEVASAHRWMEQYKSEARWGFKDPRSLLLVEGWLALLPDLQFVGISRHPEAVSRSLRKRGRITEEQALGLWRSYNSRLLDLHNQRKFPLLCFDEDEQVLHEKLDEVCAELGLKAPPDERFFSAELKHHKARKSSIPQELKALYRALREVAR